MELETDTRFERHIKAGVSNVGMLSVSSILAGKYGHSLPAWFSNEWVTTQYHPSETKCTQRDGRIVEVPIAFSGKFARRATQYLRLMHGIKVDEQTIADIGQEASRNMTKEDKVLYYDFTKKFDWMSGEFGDDGSCFWSSRALARDMLKHLGAYAIRIYDPRTMLGAGRAWIVPTDYGLAIFNAYMNDTLLRKYQRDGWALLLMAQTLSHHTKFPFKAVELVNNGRAEGNLWINNGSGFLARKTWGERVPDSIDLNCPNGIMCTRCGMWRPRESDMINVGPSWVCHTCLQEYYERCPECQRYVLKDSLYSSEEHGITRRCYRCLSSLAFICRECNNVFLREGQTQKAARELMCDECMRMARVRFEQTLRTARAERAWGPEGPYITFEFEWGRFNNTDDELEF